MTQKPGIKKTGIFASVALLALLTAGCSGHHNATPAATSSKIPETGLATDLPVSTEDAALGPSISVEDRDRGIAEGNPYVVYSGVMCFGGTLQTPEEYKQEDPSPGDYADFVENYDSIPDVVKNQSDLNRKMQSSFVAPQECSDAGWSNAGAL